MYKTCNFTPGILHRLLQTHNENTVKWNTKAEFHPFLKVPIIATQVLALCPCLPMVTVFTGNKETALWRIHVRAFRKSKHLILTSPDKQYQKKVDHRNPKIWAFTNNHEEDQRAAGSDADAAELKDVRRYPACSLSTPELPLSHVASCVGKSRGGFRSEQFNQTISGF